ENKELGYKDYSFASELTDPVYFSLLGEFNSFVGDAILSEGRLETLLTGSYSFLNEPLAQFYGVSGVAGTDFRRVNLDPAQRTGVMTRGLFLAVEATAYEDSPIKRGKFVRQQLLCQTPYPQPLKIKVAPPAPDPSATTRQRYAQHASDP